MDVRRSINTKIWADSWFECLKPTSKLLWIYLLTNQHTNMLGIYQVSMRRIMFETGLTEPQIKEILKDFETLGKAFLMVDDYIFIPNWIKNQSMNPNMMKSAENTFSVLPTSLLSELNELGIKAFESLLNPLQILRKKEKEKESEKEIEIKDGFDEFWNEYHSITKMRKTDLDDAKKKWKALSKTERELAIEMIEPYFSSLNDKKYCKKARTYLGDKNFNDEFKHKNESGF